MLLKLASTKAEPKRQHQVWWTRIQGEPKKLRLPPNKWCCSSLAFAIHSVPIAVARDAKHVASAVVCHVSLPKQRDTSIMETPQRSSPLLRLKAALKATAIAPRADPPQPNSNVEMSSAKA